MTFDDLVHKSMQMNFVYVDRDNNEKLESRILSVNANTFAALFYLHLGRELNKNLMILNWCIRSLDFDEIKFLISKFGYRNGTGGEYRQIFLVKRSPIDNLKDLFPNSKYKTIKMLSFHEDL